MGFMLCVFFYVWPAHAQDVTEAEAQRLQTVFQNILTTRKDAIATETQNQSELVLKGDVTVEAVDTYYAITFPQITINYPDGDYVDIGLISLNASPHDKPGQFRMTMALPTPILGFNGTGQEIMRIALGAQQSAGIWHEGLENFIKLDTVYTDVQITSIDTKTTLPEVRIRYDLEESENGRWSLEKVAMSIIFDEFAPEAFQKTPQNALPSLNLADGADFKLSFQGFNASKENAKGVKEELSFKQAGINFSYDEALSGSVDAHFGFNFSEVSEGNTPEELTAFIPKSGQFKLTHHNIPLGAINEIVENSAQGGPKALGIGLLLKIPAIMAQAGSYIELYETSLQNENYNLSLDTTLRADMTATNSATASGKLRFAGLDKILSLAQVEGRNLDSSKYAAPMRSFARFLERLKPLGRVETDEQNGFVHIFDLEMNKAGQLLINNQNAMLLLNEPEELKPPEPEGTDL